MMRVFRVIALVALTAAAADARAARQCHADPEPDAIQPTPQATWSYGPSPDSAPKPYPPATSAPAFLPSTSSPSQSTTPIGPPTSLPTPATTTPSTTRSPVTIIKTTKPTSTPTNISVLKVKLYNKADLKGGKLVLTAESDVCYSVDKCFEDKTTSLSWSKVKKDTKSIELFASTGCTDRSVSITSLGAIGSNGSVATLAAYSFDNVVSSFIVRSASGGGQISSESDACVADDVEDDADAVDPDDEIESDDDGGGASTSSPLTIAPKTTAPKTTVPAKSSNLKVKLYNKADLKGGKLVLTAESDVCYSVDKCFEDKTTSLSWSKVKKDTKSIELFASTGCTDRSVSITSLGAIGSNGSVATLAAYSFDNVVSSFIVRSASGGGQISSESDACVADDVEDDADAVDPDDEIESDDDGGGASTSSPLTIAPKTTAPKTTVPAKSSNLKVKLYNKADLKGGKLVLTAESDVCYSVDKCFEDKTTSLSWSKVKKDTKSIELFASTGCTDRSVFITSLGAIGSNGSVATLAAYSFDNVVSSFIVRSASGGGQISSESDACVADDVEDDADAVDPDDEIESDDDGGGASTSSPLTIAPKTTAPKTTVPAKSSNLKVKLYNKADLKGGKLVLTAESDVCYSVDKCFEDKTTSLSWSKVKKDTKSIELFASTGCTDRSVSITSLGAIGSNGSVATLAAYSFDNVVSSFIVRSASGGGQISSESDACVADDVEDDADAVDPDDEIESDDDGGGASTSSPLTIAPETTVPSASVTIPGSSAQPSVVTPEPTTPKATTESKALEVKLYGKINLEGAKQVVEAENDVCYSLLNCFDDKAASLEWSRVPTDAKSIQLFEFASCTGTSATIAGLGGLDGNGSVSALKDYKFNKKASSFIVRSVGGGDAIAGQSDGCSSSSGSTSSDALVTLAPTSTAPSPSTTVPSPTPEPTIEVPVPGTVAPAPADAFDQPTPEPTPAPTTVTPEPTPAPTTVTPEPTPAPTTVTPEPTPAPTTVTPEPTTPKATTESKALEVKLYGKINLEGAKQVVEAENDVCYSLLNCFDDKAASLEWSRVPTDAKSIQLFEFASCTGTSATIAGLGGLDGNGSVSALKDYKFNKKASSFIVRSVGGGDAIAGQSDGCSSSSGSTSSDALVTLAPTSTAPSPSTTVPSPTPEPTIEVPVPGTVAPAPADAFDQPTPEPTPAPTTVTPEPTPAPTTVTPEPTPAPTTVTPEPTPAPTTVTPEPTPAPTMVTPEPTPAPTTVTPEPTPAETTVTPTPEPIPVMPAPTVITPTPSTLAPSSTTTPTPTPTPPASLRLKLFNKIDWVGSKLVIDTHNDYCYSVDGCFDDMASSVEWTKLPSTALSLDFFSGAGCTNTSISVSPLNINSTTTGAIYNLKTFKFSNAVSSFVVRSKTGKNVIKSYVDGCVVAL